jgi:hypothetical protein
MAWWLARKEKKGALAVTHRGVEKTNRKLEIRGRARNGHLMKRKLLATPVATEQDCRQCRAAFDGVGERGQAIYVSVLIPFDASPHVTNVCTSRIPCKMGRLTIA